MPSEVDAASGRVLTPQMRAEVNAIVFQPPRKPGQRVSFPQVGARTSPPMSPAKRTTPPMSPSKMDANWVGYVRQKSTAHAAKDTLVSQRQTSGAMTTFCLMRML